MSNMRLLKVLIWLFREVILVGNRVQIWIRVFGYAAWISWHFASSSWISALSERRVLNLILFTPVCNTIFLNGPISEAGGISSILGAYTFLPGIHFPNIRGPSPRLRLTVLESPAQKVEFMLYGATSRMVTLHLTSLTLVAYISVPQLTAVTLR